MSVTATFIGGPWDLHRVALPDDAAPPTYRVPTLAKPRLALVDEANPANGDLFAKIETAHYRRCDAQTYEGRVSVYVYEGTW